MRTALVTGVTGQDGALLTQLLLDKNYQVVATHRRSSAPNFWRLDELGIKDHPNLSLREFELNEPGGAIRLIEAVQPDEVYNLAGQSFVKASFDLPVTTAMTTGVGPLCLLEAIRIINPSIRYYQASSAEMFGKVQETPQRETTPFYPRSPYGVAKLHAYWMTVNYRECYGIFGASGILFNHESPLRGLEFVTRKITDAVARIKLNKLDVLTLGNLSAQRDWGYAGEFVEGMWRILQADEPDTYVLATGATHTVRSFAAMAFEAAGISIDWVGSGADERGISTDDGRVLVRVDPTYYRPTEVDVLIGSPEKARQKLGWQPVMTIDKLCQMMVKADLRRHHSNFKRASNYEYIRDAYVPSAARI
jgi:GDPmannose 4,6-dehydratase